MQFLSNLCYGSISWKYLKYFKKKLYEVGPVDNKPFTIYLKVVKKQTKKHLTRDTWHVTPDTWHVTFDTWHMTHDGGWIFSQNVSSPALTVWDRQCLEDSKQNGTLYTLDFTLPKFKINIFFKFCYSRQVYTVFQLSKPNLLTQT